MSDPIPAHRPAALEAALLAEITKREGHKPSDLYCRIHLHAETDKDGVTTYYWRGSPLNSTPEK